MNVLSALRYSVLLEEGMKIRSILKSALLILGVELMCPLEMPVWAQDGTLTSDNMTVSVGEASTPRSIPVNLSPGVLDILKLSRAAVGDDVIIAFVMNSGKSYDLSASQIVYLKQEGVSDRVSAAILAQRMRPEQQVVAASASTPPAAASVAPQPANSSVPSVQPVPTYQELPTLSVSPSTVYMTPYPAAPYFYDAYGPYYYGGYWGYPSPSLSFSIGIGGYRGGFGGGGFHGGGGHGGGFRGGHR